MTDATNQPEFDDRLRRRDPVLKKRKHISLSPDLIDEIQAMADENGVSFSAAIEGLVRAGLGQDTATSLLPIILNSIYRTVNSSFNRMAKIATMGVIEAGQARELSQAVLLQLVAEQHAQHGDAFEDAVIVPRGHPARKLTQRFSGVARHRTVKRMRQPIADLEDILFLEEIVYDDEDRDGDL